MQFTLLPALLSAAVASACTIPSTPPSDTITAPFRLQVQNASYPQIHNKYMNLYQAGGGDQHLYIGPVGVPTSNLVLTQGVLGRGNLRAVIGGEHSQIDDTSKMFMTERGDPRAIFSPTYACNPQTDALQVELRFVGWQNHPAGGWICVRPSYDDSHEFRYYPPGNTLNDPNKFCIKVTLAALPSGDPGSTSTPTTISTSPTSVSQSSTSTTASSTPRPYADMTSRGFSFVGCAPEERTAGDGGGRTLPHAYYDDTLTNEKCVDYCKGKGYLYAGTEYRRECWCGNTLATTRQPKTTVASLSGCSMTCMGDLSQKCGGSAWLSLYKACAPGTPCVNADFS